MSKAHQLAFDLCTRRPFPDLSAKDMMDFSKSLIRIYNLMKDGEWHTATEVIETAGHREGLRTMRHLRKHFTVDKRKVKDERREFEYQLKPKECDQHT